MKLWSSFVKELKLASRGFYFYVEIVLAIILLVVVLFVIPNEFKGLEDEYVYLAGESEYFEAYEEGLIDSLDDLDDKVELVVVKNGKERVPAELYTSEDHNYYIIRDKEAVISIAENKNVIGASIEMDKDGFLSFEYYMQGYETEKLNNLLLIFHGQDDYLIEPLFDAQDVRPLSTDFDVLTDKENVMPSILTFNGSLMGLFILAAYIFMDKKEGVIKAYAITPSPVWQYLLSKVMIVTATSIVTTLIITLPVLGLSINYALLILFLLCTGLFASAVGLLLAGFFDDFAKSFGVLYMLVILLIIPNVAYFISGWDPLWVKFIPTYPMVNGFKEILLQNGDVSYVLWASLGFFVSGTILFMLANVRYKKTLSV
jgi:ABC-2 type transport system permease protein